MIQQRLLPQRQAPVGRAHLPHVLPRLLPPHAADRVNIASGLKKQHGASSLQEVCITRRRRPSVLTASSTAPTASLEGIVSPQPTDPAQPPLSYADRHGLHDAQGRLLLKNLTLSELEEWCATVGELPKRARQLYKALYGRLVRGLDELDGSSSVAFSAAFKAKVAASASLSGGLTLQSVHTARDGTHKLVFSLVPEEGGAAGTVETVLIPMTNRMGGNPRYTACLSTQVGCAMNCQFCFTGRMGLLGNLSTAQVVEQVVAARRWLAELAATADASRGATGDGGSGEAGLAPAAGVRGGQTAVGETSVRASEPKGAEDERDESEGAQVGALALLARPASGSQLGEPSEVLNGLMRMPDGRHKAWPISNIVFMGMGEPLHNYDVVMAAIDILAEGLELSRNKIIVSTVGLADAMESFLETGKAKLALSLHATTDAVRDWIVPTNRRFPIAHLLRVLRKHFPSEGAKGDKFVVIEYVLLAGVNDSPEDARRLVQLTADIYCMVNLIVFNPHEGTPFERSTDDAVRAFRRVLLDAGRVCTVRVSKGDDEMAACGQLGDPGQARKPVPVTPPPAALKDLLLGAAALKAAGGPGAVAA